MGFVYDMKSKYSWGMCRKPISHHPGLATGLLYPSYSESRNGELVIAYRVVEICIWQCRSVAGLSVAAATSALQTDAAALNLQERPVMKVPMTSPELRAPKWAEPLSWMKRLNGSSEALRSFGFFFNNFWEVLGLLLRSYWKPLKTSENPSEPLRTLCCPCLPTGQYAQNVILMVLDHLNSTFRPLL